MQYLHDYVKSMIPKLQNVLIAWAASVFAMFFMAHFFKIITPPDPYGEYIKTLKSLPTFKETVYRFFTICIMAPFVEEAIFRYLPFSFIRHRKDYKKLVIPVIIGSSIIFGWMHGDETNVLLQGIVGLMLAWVYIKNGHSYLSAVLTHCLYNFAILVGMTNFS